MVNIGTDWDEILKNEFQKEYYKNLRKFLINEYNIFEVYPPMKDIFNALKYTSFEDTKVIILGQDPYINPKEAHGLAFSIQPPIEPPPSLKNIFRELKDDCGCFIPDNGNLIPWAKQGILLLNTVLTVRRGSSNSHSGEGWENFTDTVLKILNENKENLIFLLWGKNAQKKIPLITPKRHLVLTAAHPSPLAGGRFFGCKHFSKTNKFLEEINSSIIDWQIPNIL
jgi:uracil-DNA glycosylase